MADKRKIINFDDRPWDYSDLIFWKNPEDDTTNAIVEIDGQKARARAAMLIVKDGKEILLGEEEDEPGVFSLPGGGIEEDETAKEAAERECNEEVKLEVKNIHEAGHDYLETHTEVKDWVKENVPEKYQWINYYTCLCIGEYDGKFDGKVDKEDLDPNMKKTSKFYPIKDVINDESFKLQWKKALFDAGYIKRKPIKESFKKLDIKGINDPVYVTDEAYKVANLIKRGDVAYRIFAEPNGENTEYYFTNGENNVTHYDLIVAMNKAGWTTGDYLSSDIEEPFNDSQTIVSVPFTVNKNDIVFTASIGDDGYISERVYDFGEVFVRDEVAYNWSIFKALGKPIRTVRLEDNEIVLYKADSNEEEYYMTVDLYNEILCNSDANFVRHPEEVLIQDEEVTEAVNSCSLTEAEATADEKAKLIQKLATTMTEFKALFGNSGWLSFDKLHYTLSRAEQVVGDYRESTETIRVSSTLAHETDEEVKNVIYHEFCHFVADKLQEHCCVFTSECFDWNTFNYRYNLKERYPRVFRKNIFIFNLTNDIINPNTGELLYDSAESGQNLSRAIRCINEYYNKWGDLKGMPKDVFSTDNCIMYTKQEDIKLAGHGTVWQYVANAINETVGTNITRFYSNKNNLQIKKADTTKYVCDKCGTSWTDRSRKYLTPQPWSIQHAHCGGYLHVYDIRNGQEKEIPQPWQKWQKKESLTEDTRIQLVSKSRNAGEYKDKSRGKNRFERKRYSKIATQVKQYNQLDMNMLFKQDILQVGIPVTGETDNYTVTVKIEGVVGEIAKNIKNNKNDLEFRTIIQALTKMFNTSNVYVKCTCDDFKYNFEHWSIINNFGVDDTAHDPGPGKNIRNPLNDKGKGCKHILLVLNNGDWMMKVASVINNYIHFMADHKSALFLKLIFPKLYGVPAEDMVEKGLVDDEKFLKSSTGLIDAINAYGKNRGKIKPGTNQNPVQKAKEQQQAKQKMPALLDKPAQKPEEKKPAGAEKTEPEPNKQDDKKAV